MENIKTISLKCSSCNGVLQIEENREILSCPYCGSKELISESDAVKIARTQSDAYRDVEFGRQRTELEMRRMDLQERNREVSHKFFLWIIAYALILGGIGIILFFLQFAGAGNAGMALFILALGIILIVFGVNILKSTKKK